MREPPKRVLIATPHGFCAGVRRAIETANLLINTRPAPIYCLNEIVHNELVVRDLRERGIVFVSSIADVPLGACLLFSAHGISPDVRQQAAARNLQVVDATCPFVAKVHREVIRYAQAGCSILLIGHPNHEEVKGALGEAPDVVTVVQNIEDARHVQVPDPQRVATVTQTTLSQAHANAITDVLRERFPALQVPAASDICYATTNRQHAVIQVAQQADVMLVLGSRNSANARRLVDVSEAEGTPSWLLGDMEALSTFDLSPYRAVGLTASASTPEAFVHAALDFLKAKEYADQSIVGVATEEISFPLPTAAAPLGQQFRS